MKKYKILPWRSKEGIIYWAIYRKSIFGYHPLSLFRDGDYSDFTSLADAESFITILKNETKI